MKFAERTKTLTGLRCLVGRRDGTGHRMLPGLCRLAQ